MGHDTIKNPDGSGGRVEALTIGLKEAMAIMVLIIGTGGSSALWLSAKLNHIQSIVQQNSQDRWTRGMMEQLCRILERDNKGFRCPEELPHFNPPKDPFSAG